MLEKNSAEDLQTIDITEMLELFKKIIDLDKQQDAHEFMRLFLDKIHEEFKPKLAKNSSKNYPYN
jgi:ubiquitin C-terminal hydrolase